MDDLQLRIKQVVMLVKLLKDVIDVVADFLPDGAFDVDGSEKKSFFSFLAR